MASFGKQSSCFLLFLLLLSFVSHQTEARVSKFFSKDIHLTNKDYVKVTSTDSLAKKDLSLPSLPSPAPSPLTSYISNAPTPMRSIEYGYAPAPLGNVHSPGPSPSLSPVESESAYYGLYDTNGFVSDTNNIVDNEQDKDDFSGEEFRNEDSKLLNSRDTNKFVDSYPDNLNEENEEETSNLEGYNNNNVNNNFDAGYTSEPQGMSDTRLMDNGKYYYSSEQENDVSYRQQTRSNNNNAGYSGHYDPKSKYEFDTMEEYEKQEGYPEYPQEFNP